MGEIEGHEGTRDGQRHGESTGQFVQRNRFVGAQGADGGKRMGKWRALHHLNLRAQRSSSAFGSTLRNRAFHQKRQGDEAADQGRFFKNHEHQYRKGRITDTQEKVSI